MTVLVKIHGDIPQESTSVFYSVKSTKRLLAHYTIDILHCLCVILHVRWYLLSGSSWHFFSCKTWWMENIMLYQYSTKDIKEAIKDEIKKECLIEIQKRKRSECGSDTGLGLLQELRETFRQLNGTATWTQIRKTLFWYNLLSDQSNLFQWILSAWFNKFFVKMNGAVKSGALN